MKHKMGSLLSMFAVVAFSAMAAGSAYAESPTLEWLASGAVISTPEPMSIEGEWLREDMKGTDILCSNVIDGTMGPGAFTLIEKMLNLAGTSETIVCSFISAGSCEAGMAPQMQAIHLPWLGELVLETGVANPIDLLKEDEGHGLPGWLVECLVLGFTIDDECTEETGADIENNVAAGDVEQYFLGHLDELVTPPGNCSVGGAKEGLVENDPATGGGLIPGLTTLNSGLLLSISGDGLGA